MDQLIVNCDLGEAEPTAQTARLMSSVDAANICCGVHAGSLEKTRETLLLAKQNRVMVGAHPGLAAAGGRGGELPSVADFGDLLKAQLGAFTSLATELEVEVSYVKLHGSLYSAVEADALLLRVYIDVLRELDLDLGLFSLAGGQCAVAARGAGFRVWEEVFADRGYSDTGALVPRGSVGALLGLREAKHRFERWYGSSLMSTVGHSSDILLSAETICVHSDSPDALQLVRQIKVMLDSSAQ